MNRDLPPHRQPIYRYRHSLSALTLPTSNEAIAAESCSLFIVLRHRTPSSPIGLYEVIHKLLALSRVFFLSSGGKSILLVKEKAPSRSGILLSMHVVLKTRHVNLNIHTRRYQSHVRSPNFSSTRPQLLSLRGGTTQYRSLHKAIQESRESYIAFFIILYSSTHVPIYLQRALRKPTSSLLVPSFLDNRSLQAEKFEGGKCKL